MKNQRRAALIEGPIAPVLVRLSLQMMKGIIAMMAFNLVDTFFVGQLGETELAAMSFALPVVLILNSLAFLVFVKLLIQRIRALEYAG